MSERQQEFLVNGEAVELEVVVDEFDDDNTIGIGLYDHCGNFIYANFTITRDGIVIENQKIIPWDIIDKARKRTLYRWEVPPVDFSTRG